MAFTFSYPSSPYALATGVAVDISRVIVSGIQPSNTVYKISPGLPSPLTINSINGAITGLPTFSSISPITNYTVDASYSTAVVSTTLQLGVNFLPVFSYPFSPYIKQLNTAASIVPIYLISNLQGITYSIISSPPLTDISLNLNDVNGVITGTPNIASAETTYIIRANNAGVIYDASLNISVQTLPTISYPEGTYNLTQGVAVSIIPTEDTSQTYVSYSIKTATH